MAAPTSDNGAKQINDPHDAVSSTKTAGKILFVMCLVMAVSTYLLNSALSKQQQLLRAKSERYVALTEMIERLHSFKEKDADLFENLATASIENATRYPDLVPTISIGPNRKAFLEMPDKRSRALLTDAHEFGVDAAKAFLAESSPDERARKFQSLVSSAYRDDTEAALFLNTKIVPRLARIDSRSEWDQIVWWIVSGDWFGPNSVQTGVAASGVTFTGRFAEPYYEVHDRYHVNDLLQFAPDLESADKALMIIWQQSYAEQETTVAPPSALLPALGLSVPVETIVLGAAPVLLLFQLMFFVHWDRQRSIVPPGTNAFAFPAYACPCDPLKGPMPRTLADAVQRFVWMLFLVLPTALISIGLLTRYDLVYPLGYLSGKSNITLFNVELHARSADALSSSIDWVTFACIAMSAIAVLNITRECHAPGEYRKHNRAATLLGWSAAVAMAIACTRTTVSTYQAVIAPLPDASYFPFNMQYLAAFGVFWSLYFGIACECRARLAMLFSGVGLLAFVLHFIPISLLSGSH